MTTYTHILDLAKEAEPPADGILSRTNGWSPYGVPPGRPTGH